MAPHRLALAGLVAALAGVCTAATAAPNDTHRSAQWALDKIQVDRAWATSTGRGIVIAVVDTGIDLGHPDLSGKIAGAYTCIGGCRAGGQDDQGHGTHVAGIAAATTGNAVGIAGTASESRLMAVKVLNERGEGHIRDVAAGVRWAADRGARVVNLSLGPEIPLVVNVFDLSALQSAVTYADSKGALVVAAAGNEALPASFYTGTQGMYVVGATGPDDRLAWYSSSEVGVDIYAPGGNSGSSNQPCTQAKCILSTWLGGGYASAQGTSMAAPHISGVGALLLAKGGSPAEARSRMSSTADRTPDGLDRVNAAAAVGPPPTPTAAPAQAGPAATANAGSQVRRGATPPRQPGAPAVSAPDGAPDAQPRDAPAPASDVTPTVRPLAAPERRGAGSPVLPAVLAVLGATMATAGALLWRRVRTRA